MATSAGYTAATGTDYWVATYNGDRQQRLGQQRPRRRAGDHRQGHACFATTASVLNVGSEPSTRPRSSAGDPTGTVTFNLYNNSTASGTPLFTDTNTLTTAPATRRPPPADTGPGTYYWVATYNGDSNNSQVTSDPASSR